MTEKTIHEGRNVKRIREILGIKQDVLAVELGLSQQAVSLLEQKEALDKDILEKIANTLKVPAAAIKNFSEEMALSNIQNNYEGAVINAGPALNYNCTFNPIEKIVELYDKLLKEKDEKIALLEKTINNK